MQVWQLLPEQVAQLVTGGLPEQLVKVNVAQPAPSYPATQLLQVVASPLQAVHVGEQASQLPGFADDA